MIGSAKTLQFHFQWTCETTCWVICELITFPVALNVARTRCFNFSSRCLLFEALCQNVHWLFDVGLWSLDDDDRGIGAETAFDKDSPDQTPLKQMVGRRIRRPRKGRHWLLITNLAAHWWQHANRVRTDSGRRLGPCHSKALAHVSAGCVCRGQVHPCRSSESIARHPVVCRRWVRCGC